MFVPRHSSHIDDQINGTMVPCQIIDPSSSTGFMKTLLSLKLYKTGVFIHTNSSFKKLMFHLN